MITVRLPANDWRPRDYQLPLWRYLQNGGLRADAAWHRRAGKDEIALHHAACAAHKRVGNYWHMLPEAEQARKAIWNAINPHTGKKRIDEAFPPIIRSKTNDHEMRIEFKCGSSWQVVGSDNYNSLVGAPPIGIVFSEWALAKPDSWNYLRPILLENNGWAFFIWTPRGKNHAVRAFEAREKDGDWFTQRLRADQTDVFTAEQLAKERADLIAECGSEEEGDARFRQEYLVDFYAAIPGSYFGSLIAKLETQGRVTRIPWNPRLPVFTSWDIGVDDYTSIWFFQVDGSWVNVIAFFESQNIGAEQIVRLALNSQPYTYGRHFFPHDIKVREWGAGARSRVETMIGLGIPEEKIHPGAAQDPDDRINASRQLLPLCRFDAEGCAAGLDHMRSYRRTWNKNLSVYTGPQHDEHSHAADAFGEFAVNCQIKPPITREISSKITGIEQMTIEQAWKNAQPRRDERSIN